ncbi:MAG: DUF885 family protein [Armatimonadetes bacterium]|nr:DUF885 family protein [Armatimonadota bacterium]
MSDRMADLLTALAADFRWLGRQFSLECSPEQALRGQRLLSSWRQRLDALPAVDLARDDQLDRLLALNWLDLHAHRLERDLTRQREIAPLAPFLMPLAQLDDQRRRMDDLDPRAAAEVLARAAGQAEACLKSAEPGEVSAVLRSRAVKAVERVKTALADFDTFYAGYDPLYSWWCAAPMAALVKALGSFIDEQKRLAGLDDEAVIVGDPIGRHGLVEELAATWVPYEPEELVAVGRAQMDFCLGELRAAAAEMGLGDDWRAALERVKNDHVPPGQQPALVRDLAVEAIGYLEGNDLLTVPDTARDGWRMSMMSAERQKVNPFFLGGEQIIISFPTSEMPHEAKLMSLRGNNRHFCRATVQHELIPGHFMQSYWGDRLNTHRRLFYNPFWVEGWPLHWEMLLYERGYPQSPENRVGMLFWRLHRAARIVFSIEFHLGLRSAEQCVEMLIHEVGHEPDNARGEVRRSLGGDYDALYQAAYLLGGLQVRRAYREALAQGQTPRQFHDGFIRAGCMPIAAARALLLGLPFDEATLRGWRFLDEA